MDIMIEYHGLWRLPAALKIADALKDYDIYWHEEPVWMQNFDDVARYRDKVNTQVAGSENFGTTQWYREMFVRGAVDVANFDIAWVGGISEAQRIAHLAAAFDRAIAPHDCTGPVTFRNVHLLMAYPNGLIAETVRAHTNGFYADIVTTLPPIRNGLIHPTESPVGVGARSYLAESFGASRSQPTSFGPRRDVSESSMQPATSISEMPPGACDCHMHVYDGPGIVPATFAIPEANLIRYRTLMQRLGLSRVVVVQSMLYANDNRIFLSAMDQLGDCARAALSSSTQKPPTRKSPHWIEGGYEGFVPSCLVAVHTHGATCRTLTERIAPFGWHLQVQMDGRELERASLALSRLPVPVVIDHVGKFLKPVAVDHAGFVALRRLVASGQCWVKLSGMYETSKTGAPDYADVSALASVLIADAPHRLLWGSNWPHPNHQPPPDDLALFAHFATLVPDLDARRRILVDNPAKLYRFPSAGEGGT